MDRPTLPVGSRSLGAGLMRVATARSTLAAGERPSGDARTPVVEHSMFNGSVARSCGAKDSGP